MRPTPSFALPSQISISRSADSIDLLLKPKLVSYLACSPLLKTEDVLGQGEPLVPLAYLQFV